MPNDVELCQQALDLVTLHGNRAEAARQSDVTYTTLFDRLQRAKYRYNLTPTVAPPTAENAAQVEELTRKIAALEQQLRDATKPRFTIRQDQQAGERINVCVIGDAHDSPGLDQSRFTWIGAHINDHRPDVVVQIGDFATLDSLNTHEQNHTLKGREKPSYADDMLSFNEALGRLNDPIKYEPEKHVTLGNHERRAWLFENENPETAGMMQMEITGKLDKHGWTYAPYGEISYFGGVGFVHAALNRLGKTYGGKNAEMTIANDCVHDLVIGHSHTARFWPAPKIGHNRRVKVLNAGCALPHGHVEDYAKHSSTGWEWGVWNLTIKGNHITGQKFYDMLELEEKYGC